MHFGIYEAETFAHLCYEPLPETKSITFHTDTNANTHTHKPINANARATTVLYRIACNQNVTFSRIYLTHNCYDCRIKYATLSLLFLVVVVLMVVNVLFDSQLENTTMSCVFVAHTLKQSLIEWQWVPHTMNARREEIHQVFVDVAAVVGVCVS